MKGKFTFNRLLHNNKLMIIVSIITAIAVWASVVYGTSILDVGKVTVPVNLNISNTFLGIKENLKNFSSTSQAVDVEVKGSRWVLSSDLTSDIKVTPDFGSINGPGRWTVTFSAQKISDKSFEIGIVNPPSVTIYCDYEQKKEIPIEADISGVDVKDSSNEYLGTPAMSLDKNTVTIDGPQTVVSKIATIKAKVDKPDTISQTTTFSATLEALDSDGNEVSNIDYCSFIGLDGNKVNVIVPVNIHRTVKFSLSSLTFKNMPDAYKNNSNFCTVSPASIELIGTPDQVGNYAESIEKAGAVGTIDFNHLSPFDPVKKIPLNIPQGIREKDGISELTVSFSMQNYSTALLDVPLSSLNTHLQNIPSGHTALASQQTLSGVTVVGPSDTVAKIKETDISVTIDLANNDKSREVTATLQVPGYNNVWLYYGDPNTNGYPVYVTIQ